MTITDYQLLVAFLGSVILVLLIILGVVHCRLDNYRQIVDVLPEEELGCIQMIKLTEIQKKKKRDITHLVNSPYVGRKE